MSVPAVTSSTCVSTDAVVLAIAKATTLAYRLTFTPALVSAGEHYGSDLQQARQGLRSTLASIHHLNPTSEFFAVMEAKHGTYHSHLLVVGPDALVCPVLNSDHWWDPIADNAHARHWGVYVLKGATSTSTYQDHLDMNGGHLAAVSPGFWSGPWGDTFADCHRARRRRARFPRPKKIRKKMMFTPEARDAHRSAADAAAIATLRTLQDALGGMPRRWTAGNTAIAAAALQCSPGSVRTTVGRAHRRVLALKGRS